MDIKEISQKSILPAGREESSTLLNSKLRQLIPGSYDTQEKDISFGLKLCTELFQDIVRMRYVKTLDSPEYSGE